MNGTKTHQTSRPLNVLLITLQNNCKFSYCQAPEQELHAFTGDYSSSSQQTVTYI